MKKTLLTLLFVVELFGAYCQDYKEKIEQQFLEYTNFLIKKDFTKSVEYINDDFFKILPKSQMIILIEKTYNNPDLDFKIENPKVLRIDSIKRIGDQNYVKLQYSNILNMKFKESTSDTSDVDERELKKNLIIISLEKQFGTGNVKHNQLTGYYEIYSVKNVIANSKDTNSWKFVTVEEKQKIILENFIPKELLEK